MNDIKSQVVSAFEARSLALEALFDAESALVDAKRLYDARVTEAYINGEVDGKNEKIRSAQEKDAAAVEALKVQNAENALSVAKLELRLADNKVDCINYLLRAEGK